MLVIAAEISVKPDQIDAFKDLIAWQAESSVAEEPGCQQFDVCQAEWDPNQFLLYEVYSDADAFDAHMAVPRFKEFFDKASPMMASEPTINRLNRLNKNIK